MGVQPGLAGLQLHEVQHLRLAGQYEVVERSSSTAARCRTGVAAQARCAARAVSKAAATSSGVDSGSSASTSPVNGERLRGRPAAPHAAGQRRDAVGGVTTSAAVRARSGAGATGLPAECSVRGAVRVLSCESVMRVSVRPRARPRIPSGNPFSRNLPAIAGRTSGSGREEPGSGPERARFRAEAGSARGRGGLPLGSGPRRLGGEPGRAPRFRFGRGSDPEPRPNRERHPGQPSAVQESTGAAYGGDRTPSSPWPPGLRAPVRSNYTGSTA